ncbi:MAG: hypothetical protein ACMXYL_05620 [Candidatus Woesearchaeota archaeon]
MIKTQLANLRILLPLIIFLLLSLPGITQSYWIDEIFSVRDAKTLNELLIDVHPPIYTLVLKGWIGIFGDTELATRSLSLIAGGTAIIIVSLISFKAGLLMSLSPIVHDISTTTRSYSLLLLFGSIALYYAVKDKRHTYIPTILMSMTHYYGIFASIGYHAYDIIKNKKRESYYYAAIWIAVVGSWVLYHAYHIDFNRGGWIREYALLEFLAGSLGSTIPIIGLAWIILIYKIPMMELIIIGSSLLPPMIISLIRPIMQAHYTIAILPIAMLMIARRAIGAWYIIILIIAIIAIPYSPSTFISQDYKSASEMILGYDNPMIISIVADQSYYFGETRVCEHPECIRWAMKEEYDSIWLLNGAFVDIETYTEPLLESHEEEILWFDSLEVRKYVPIS